MDRREFILKTSVVGAAFAARPAFPQQKEGDGPLDVVHFPNSYMTFTTANRGNNARILVECRCTIKDLATNAATDYYVIASCKGEDTYGKGVLFNSPAYDFSGVFSQDQFVLIRVGMNTGTEVDTRDAVAGRFEGVDLHIERDAEPKALETYADIVQATLNHIPIVGRVEFDDPAGTYRTLVEFPIKTMNVNDIQNIFQVDTGPVAFPDWEVQTERIIDKLKLAFVAYNDFERADFEVQEVTAAVELQEGQTVNEVPRYRHYSRIVSGIKATNAVIACSGRPGGAFPVSS